MSAVRSCLRLMLLMASAALLAACANDPARDQPSFYRSLANPTAQVDAEAAASMISGYRRNNGLSTVAVDPELMRLAAEQARAMARRDKLDHDVGRSFSLRIGVTRTSAAAENVSAGYHTLAEAFSGWRDSPPHRANMLKTGMTRIGIATAYAPQSKFKVYWALILAAPDERS